MDNPEFRSFDNYFQYKDKFPHLDWDTDTGWGWLPPNDEVFDAFRYVAKHIQPQVIFEIGYYRGHSTSYLAHLMEDATIISCCPDHPKFAESHRKVRKEYDSRVTVLGIKSPEIVEHMFPAIDFAFIDGNHGVGEVFTDISVCTRFSVPWIMCDNTDLGSVQKGIEYYTRHGILEKVSSWKYTGINKDKRKVNEMTLYKNIGGKVL